MSVNPYDAPDADRQPFGDDVPPDQWPDEVRTAVVRGRRTWRLVLTAIVLGFAVGFGTASCFTDEPVGWLIHAYLVGDMAAAVLAIPGTVLALPIIWRESRWKAVVAAPLAVVPQLNMIPLFMAAAATDRVLARHDLRWAPGVRSWRVVRQLSE